MVREARVSAEHSVQMPLKGITWRWSRFDSIEHRCPSCTPLHILTQHRADRHRRGVKSVTKERSFWCLRGEIFAVPRHRRRRRWANVLRFVSFTWLSTSTAPVSIWARQNERGKPSELRVRRARAGGLRTDWPRRCRTKTMRPRGGTEPTRIDWRTSPQTETRRRHWSASCIYCRLLRPEQDSMRSFRCEKRRSTPANEIWNEALIVAIASSQVVRQSIIPWSRRKQWRSTCRSPRFCVNSFSYKHVPPSIACHNGRLLINGK